MLRKMMVLPLLMAAFSVHGADEISSKGRIAKVTVFPDSATVVRESMVRLEAGERVVRIAGLPRRLLRDSVMARGVRGGGLTVLDTRIRREYADPVKGPEEKRLEGEIKRLREARKAVRMRRGLLKRRLDFLEQLRISSIKDINNKIKIRAISTAEWDKLYRYIFDKVGVLMDLALKVDRELKALDKQIDTLKKKLANLDRRGSKSETVARVSVRVERSGVYRLFLEYRVRSAGWRPVYEVRLNDDGKSADVAYYASIRQRTGEDWSGVELELATASAGRWRRIPDQRPWLLYLGRFFGFRDSTRSARTKRYSGGAPSGMAKDREKPAPDDSTIARTRLVSGGVSVRFTVPGKASIPSGPGMVRRMLQTASLPVTLLYRAFPNYADKVFVEGVVKNSSKLHFLPGRVRVFRDGAQIGRTSLGNIAPGGSFKLFFGNDPGVVTKKELLEKKTDPGRDNEVYYTYRLTVHNNGNNERKVLLIDALPASTNTEIEVDIKEMSLKPISKNMRGIYRWSFTLKPGEKKTVRYKVKIEYPSKKGIRGLR